MGVRRLWNERWRWLTHLGEVLGEGAEARGVEGARAEGELASLLRQRLDDVRVAVALVDGAEGRVAVRFGFGLEPRGTDRARTSRPTSSRGTRCPAEKAAVSSLRTTFLVRSTYFRVPDLGSESALKDNGQRVVAVEQVTVSVLSFKNCMHALEMGAG